LWATGKLTHSSALGQTHHGIDDLIDVENHVKADPRTMRRSLLANAEQRWPRSQGEQ